MCLRAKDPMLKSWLGSVNATARISKYEKDFISLHKVFYDF